MICKTVTGHATPTHFVEPLLMSFHVCCDAEQTAMSLFCWTTSGIFRDAYAGTAFGSEVNDRSTPEDFVTLSLLPSFGAVSQLPLESLILRWTLSSACKAHEIQALSLTVRLAREFPVTWNSTKWRGSCQEL